MRHHSKSRRVRQARPTRPLPSSKPWGSRQDRDNDTLRGLCRESLCGLHAWLPPHLHGQRQGVLAEGSRASAGSRQSRGKPVVNLINIAKDEKIAAVLPIRVPEGHFLVFATAQGYIRRLMMAFSTLAQAVLSRLASTTMIASSTSLPPQAVTTYSSEPEWVWLFASPRTTFVPWAERPEASAIKLKKDGMLSWAWSFLTRKSIKSSPYAIMVTASVPNRTSIDVKAAAAQVLSP